MFIHKAKGASRTHPMASKDLDPFTKACELDSITALLSPIDDLGQYSGSFIAAQIDTELATRMTMQDLRMLLPDAPLGHCLRIHSELSGVQLHEQDIPRAAIWRTPALIISSSCLDDNGRTNMTILLEFTLVSASLLLALSVSGMMTLYDECADGTKCQTLRDVDYTLWIVSTALFLFSIQSSWLVNFASSMQTDSQLPHWQVRHFAIVVCPHASFITGLNVLAAAFTTRAWIMTESQTLSVAVPAIMATQNVCVWALWFNIAMTVGGLRASELGWNQLGAFGWYLPTRLLRDGGRGVQPASSKSATARMMSS
jgi:hypothetical protein